GNGRLLLGVKRTSHRHRPMSAFDPKRTLPYATLTHFQPASLTMPCSEPWALAMRRRDFLTLVGGATAMWPVAARAQQPTVPVVGVLDPRLPGNVQDLLRVFRQGLKDTGYVEGENVALEYRWAENQMDRLPTLAAELVRRRVAVIAAISPAAAVAAKAATTTLPSRPR